MIFLALLLLPSVDTYAQDRDYTLALRGVALDEALERFVDATGTAVSYDPALVRGRTASCAAERIGVEAVLRCILDESGLDFYRLSSGTYVLTESTEVTPQRGFVAGRVIDRDTGSPIADSHVHLADANLATVSNHRGRFTFPDLLPGRYTLTVTHLGYRTWRDTLFVAPREQVQAEASLRSESIFITPVVVDGIESRLPSDALGQPVAHASAPPVGVAAGQAQDPFRQLRTLQGVRLNDVTADVHVQGGDAGAHQFRLDGVPVFLPRSMAGLVGPFSSFSLEKITVHKAGFGAAHGSRIGAISWAEHALADVNDLDVQADPFSLNARVRLSPGDDGPRRISAMVATRIGLWDIRTPTRLQETLEGWSRPDPFLILAPIEESEAAEGIDEPSFLRSAASPSLNYSDVHAAARIRFGPLRSLQASFYEGRQRLGGGVLSDSRYALGEMFSPAEFTVIDDYAWKNRLGQVRYDAVVGSRTLASLQLRASTYRLRHDHEAIDSLDVVLQNGSPRLASLSTIPATDGNRVSSFAIEGSVDHTRGPHHVIAGAEGGLLDSRFDLRSVFFGDRHEDVGDEHAVDPQEGADVPTNRTQSSVHNVSDTWYLAGHAEDRLRLSPSLQTELGVRLTYMHALRTVYAEPRAALRLDRSDGILGAWSARMSAGLYRQYLNQTDASKLNAGTLLPAVRIWLPVDATVRPPMAYHLAQEMVFKPTSQWAIRAEGYAKYEAHGLALAYSPANSSSFASGAIQQMEFLVSTRGFAYGASVSLSRESRHLRAETRYAYGRASRKSPSYFGGDRHPVPWSEPHRLEVVIDWTPADGLALSARWHGVWQRPWGFRQAYYDYFGHDAGTRFHPPFDLGDPGAHVLPPLYQLDLSLAYTQSMGPAVFQLRAEIINVLDRENVLDWRLVKDGPTWRREERTLYPMIPAVAVRMGI